MESLPEKKSLRGRELISNANEEDLYRFLGKPVFRAAYITGFEIGDSDLKIFCSMVHRMYPSLPVGDITKALDRGCTGYYGRVYSMNLQTLFVWIRCYANGCKPRDLEFTKDRL